MTRECRLSVVMGLAITIMGATIAQTICNYCGLTALSAEHRALNAAHVALVQRQDWLRKRDAQRAIQFEDLAERVSRVVQAKRLAGK